jgi:hypothetical protein
MMTYKLINYWDNQPRQSEAEDRFADCISLISW